MSNRGLRCQSIGVVPKPPVRVVYSNVRRVPGGDIRLDEGSHVTRCRGVPPTTRTDGEAVLVQGQQRDPDLDCVTEINNLVGHVVP